METVHGRCWFGGARGVLMRWRNWDCVVQIRNFVVGLWHPMPATINLPARCTPSFAPAAKSAATRRALNTVSSNTSSTTRTTRLADTAWMIFWAVMIASHVPGMAAAVAALFQAPSSDALLRVAGLGVSQAFFVLKLLDVPFLRVRASRRSVLVLTVAFTLLHADVLARQWHNAGLPAELPIAVQTVTGSVLLASLVLVAVGLRRSAPATSAGRAPLRLWIAQRGDACLLNILAPPLLRTLPDRAPPR